MVSLTRLIGKRVVQYQSTLEKAEMFNRLWKRLRCSIDFGKGCDVWTPSDGMGRSVGFGVVTAESTVLWLKTSMLNGSVSNDLGKGCEVDGMGRSVGLGVVIAESTVLWLETSLMNVSLLGLCRCFPHLKHDQWDDGRTVWSVVKLIIWPFGSLWE